MEFFGCSFLLFNLLLRGLPILSSMTRDNIFARFNMSRSLIRAINSQTSNKKEIVRRASSPEYEAFKCPIYCCKDVFSCPSIVKHVTSSHKQIPIMEMDINDKWRYDVTEEVMTPKHPHPSATIFIKLYDNSTTPIPYFMHWWFIPGTVPEAAYCKKNGYTVPGRNRTIADEWIVIWMSCVYKTPYYFNFTIKDDLYVFSECCTPRLLPGKLSADELKGNYNMFTVNKACFDEVYSTQKKMYLYIEPHLEIANNN